MTWPKLRDKPLIFLDVETTGLDPETHEIIEFAGIRSDNGAILDLRIQPQHIETASPKALEVNGYNEADWADAVSPETAAQMIGEFMTGIPVGHNTQFDLQFIRALLAKTGLVDTIDRRHGDTQTLALAKLVPQGLESLSLRAVMLFLGLSPEPEIHRAINGARSCQKIWDRLTGSDPFAAAMWSVRARNCLQNMGVTSFQQLRKFSRAELLAQSNLGVKTVKEIESVLMSHGFKLRDDT